MKVNEIIVEGPWDAIKAFGKGVMGGAKAGTGAIQGGKDEYKKYAADKNGYAANVAGEKVLQNRANEIYKGWERYAPQARLDPADLPTYQTQLDNYIKLWLKQPKIIRPENAQLAATKEGVVEYISASIANYMRFREPEQAQQPPAPAGNQQQPPAPAGNAPAAPPANNQPAGNAAPQPVPAGKQLVITLPANNGVPRRDYVKINKIWYEEPNTAAAGGWRTLSKIDTVAEIAALEKMVAAGKAKLIDLPPGNTFGSAGYNPANSGATNTAAPQQPARPQQRRRRKTK